MPLVAVVFAALAALLHVVFFVFESVLWTRPTIWQRFGVTSQQEADTTKFLAYNQGFYNLFLGVGVLVGLSLLRGHLAAGRALVLFGCVSMAAAAVVLIGAKRSMWRATAIQFVPPALAVILALTV